MSRDHSYFREPGRPHVYVTGAPGAVYLVIWRPGDEQGIEAVPVADPLAMVRELIERYREHIQGQPRPNTLGEP